MTRRLTLLFAALEAVLVVAIGVAIPLVPLTLTWALTLGFAPDWLIFWRASVDVWLLGHGVDVTVTLDPTTAAGLGIAGADAPIVLTIALLGFALLTIGLGLRAGRRVMEAEHPVIGGLTATVVTGALSWLVAWSAHHPIAEPGLRQAAVLPAAIFGGAILVGALRERALEGRDDAGSPNPLARVWRTRPLELRAGLAAAGRIGAGSALLTLAASALVVLVLLVTSYGEVIRLYEASHTGVVGGIVVTALQLALLPDLAIWAASWLTGPGFGIGTGSSVSPLGTALGPLPPLPVLGALPSGDLPLGFTVLLVPVVLAFLAGVGARPLLTRTLGAPPSLVVGLASGIGGGLLGGLLLGLAAWAASGSAGPGRLVHVGPDPVAVGLAAAAEFAIAGTLGLLSAGVLPRRVRDLVEPPAPAEDAARGVFHPVGPPASRDDADR